ncbi:MAG TPA: DUF3237 domain-containing protein [Burkholderiaceae bacterium]|nr:DUF3237 domain-containing protein [Burkholderiaceae bacterium]
MMTLSPPKLEHVADLEVFVDAPIEVGATDGGLRRLIAITGGTVAGPKLRGRVLPGGADFQIVRPDSVAVLDARYVIELDDGTRAFVSNRALRRATPELTAKLMRGEPVDPALVYFRCVPEFEVPPGRWRWLAESVFVGTGARRPDRVELSIYRMC